MADSASTAVTGAFFGAALAASNVYSPSVILTQLELSDHHMLQVFLSASAVSAVIMALLERVNIAQRQPRNASSIGWIGSYDANVLGGLLHGIGMALTGACPGTVFVQLATGVSSAVPTLVGGIVGGIFFARYGSALRRNGTPASQIAVKPQTVATKFDIDPNVVLWAFEMICFLVIGLVSLLGSPEAGALLHPVVGGAFIGLAQAISLILTRRALGVSTAYDEAGKYFWYIIGSGKSVQPSFRTSIFASGVTIGGLIVSQVASVTAGSSSIGATRAFLGGTVMIFGARLAGGCTSGHGISGMSTFSISSIITVAAMFGGGIATVKLLSTL